MIPSKAFWLALLLVHAALSPAPSGDAPSGFARRREEAPRPFILVDGGRPAADLAVLSGGEPVRNGAEWIARFAGRIGDAPPAVGGAERLPTAGRHIIAAVGDADAAVAALTAAGKLAPIAGLDLGPQGFAIDRVEGPGAADLLVVRSPAPIGCRYGLIEVLRSLEVEGRTVRTSFGRVVDRPEFPVRIAYMNFAEHLQNGWNPNVLFDSPRNRWSDADWERWIDMLSAFRFNVFEFWLVPSLFSPEALAGGKIPAEFARTMARTIAYGKGRGIDIHPIGTVNCVGASWHYHCPRDPKEHDEIIALWDHWARALPGLASIGFFPGDPGGCVRNGCTAETFVDLCLELARVVRRGSPDLRIEVGTWGEPFAGWGVPLWTGKPERAEKAMRYFLGKLPEFPPGTFTSINLGFSPDCLVSHGGDGRPWAREAARLVPVLTWDYSATEGEGTVSPRCRVRRIFERRREERALGPYSGGIAYTMAPRLNAVSLFAAAEAYWDPSREPVAVLADFGRLVFGEARAEAGPLLEEFEVIPDWGHVAPFPFTPERLEGAMARLAAHLDAIPAGAESRLPLAVPLDEYRRSLRFFADLFLRLARARRDVDELTAGLAAAGKIPAGRPEPASVDEAEEILAGDGDFPGRDRVAVSAAALRALDIRGLRRSYWETVYGIYDVIPRPADPRAEAAADTLFRHFRAGAAMPRVPGRLEKALAASGKPFAHVALGSPAGERGWTLDGFEASGEHDGETWRASFERPGTIARDDFRDRGYRWLVVRLTEGPAGGRKWISLNGRAVGEFLRTGPAREVRKEWWVTRSWPIPEGLLADGRIEIRFTGPGIAIAAAALATEPIVDER